MRIVTLNVNGIRSAASKGLFRWLRRTEPDLVCLQEVKCDEVDIPEKLRFPDGLHGFFHCAQRRGYSGAAMYAAKEPRAVRLGFGSAEFDTEGRYVEAEFKDFTAISVYFPSGSSGPERQAAKYRFLAEFAPHLEKLRASGREIVFCGDVNIAHREIDLKKLAQQSQELGLPAGGTCMADRHLRWRLDRCLQAPRPASGSVHLVEQPRPGLGQERRLAHRLPDRHARLRGARAANRDLHGEALFRSRSAHHRLHGAPVSECDAEV